MKFFIMYMFFWLHDDLPLLIVFRTFDAFLKLFLSVFLTFSSFSQFPALSYTFFSVFFLFTAIIFWYSFTLTSCFLLSNFILYLPHLSSPLHETFVLEEHSLVRWWKRPLTWFSLWVGQNVTSREKLLHTNFWPDWTTPVGYRGLCLYARKIPNNLSSTNC